MLENFKESSTIYYLIEVNEVDGQKYSNPLAKQWNSNSFMSVNTPEQAHKFNDKDSALKMAVLQNLMNAAFDSNNVVYVVEGTTTNKLYSSDGEEVNLSSFDEQTSESDAEVSTETEE